MHRLLYPRERDPVPIVQEAVWTPGSGQMGMENPAPPEIRLPPYSEQKRYVAEHLEDGSQ